VWPPKDPDTIRPSRTPELYPLSPIRCPATVRLVDPVLGPFVMATELTKGIEGQTTIEKLAAVNAAE
jgi:hypothetical protein